MDPARSAYRPVEVARMLGVPTVRVQRWLLSGEIPGTKIGGLWFVAAADLEARLRGYDADDARTQRGQSGIVTVATHPGPDAPARSGHG